MSSTDSLREGGVVVTSQETRECPRNHNLKHYIEVVRNPVPRLSPSRRDLIKSTDVELL